jgi:hypothetical protein
MNRADHRRTSLYPAAIDDVAWPSWCRLRYASDSPADQHSPRAVPIADSTWLPAFACRDALL